MRIQITNLTELMGILSTSDRTAFDTLVSRLDTSTREVADGVISGSEAAWLHGQRDSAGRFPMLFPSEAKIATFFDRLLSAPPAAAAKIAPRKIPPLQQTTVDKVNVSHVSGSFTASDGTKVDLGTLAQRLALGSVVPGRLDWVAYQSARRLSFPGLTPAEQEAAMALAKVCFSGQASTASTPVLVDAPCYSASSVSIAIRQRESYTVSDAAPLPGTKVYLNAEVSPEAVIVRAKPGAKVLVRLELSEKDPIKRAREVVYTVGASGELVIPPDGLARFQAPYTYGPRIVVVEPNGTGAPTIVANVELPAVLPLSRTGVSPPAP
ncbi:MAG: hypothetical protein IT381_19210 [Deltaproteobacteria bacterium]|nr:hypothetical protein [Deltaproteobacteria bacterium]